MKMKLSDVGSPMCYRISCCNTGHVLMSKERLFAALNLLPCLQYLLFGHPEMASVDVEVIDGIPILEIDEDFHVSTEVFIATMNFMLDVIPPRSSRVGPVVTFDQVVETIAKFGGSSALTNQIVEDTKNASYTIKNPLRPSEDVNAEYTWYSYSELTEKTHLHQERLGSSYTGLFPAGENHFDGGNKNFQHFFRVKNNVPNGPFGSNFAFNKPPHM